MRKYFINFDFKLYNEILLFNKNNKKIKQQQINKKIFKNLQKNTIIIPFFLNKKFSVYNGKNYKIIQINKTMIGSKVGFYINSKKFVIHNNKKKDKKKRK